jgi:hypothetical protein
MTGLFLAVRLRLTASEDRRVSGWRGVCFFDGIVAPDGASLFGCELRLEGTDRWVAGHEVRGLLKFWVPRAYVRELAPGLGVHLFEGGHEIASGVVVEVHAKKS